jgi:hypothetical protein
VRNVSEYIGSIISDAYLQIGPRVVHEPYRLQLWSEAFLIFDTNVKINDQFEDLLDIRGCPAAKEIYVTLILNSSHSFDRYLKFAL